LKGVARVLKRDRPETKIVVCEPDNSPILASGIPQKRDADGAPAESHPAFRTHMMQGWGPDFIPKLAEDVQGMELIDQFMPIAGDDAVRLSRELAVKEGIFVGISGGATFAGALKVCETAPRGSVVLAMLPDTGERYLSTPLFEQIPVDMTDEEVGISKSTPNYRFDVAATPAVEEESPVTAEASAFVSEVVADAEQPVVMFALEWCEFCWSVRKLFARCDVPYRSIDLDSVKYQEDNWGGKVRAALRAKTDCGTVPQVFIGGEFVGGCTETFDAFNAGELQTVLSANSVIFNRGTEIDPYSLLPTWLHPR
jgi:cysteine synthase A